MVVTIFGFLFGAFIPYMARRFEKFMPATFAYAVYRIVKPNKSVSRKKKRQNHKYIELMRAYWIYSVGWGVVCAGLTYLTYVSFVQQVFAVGFVWVMLLLFEIDKRMLILPDILTIPLLIMGFCFSVYSGWVGSVDSALGAFMGYFMPVVASAFLVWRKKDVFGGGDVKLLAAVGAWVGVEKILYVIMLACVIFGVYALLNRKKDGAFGPAVVMASIVVMFLYYGIGG